MIAKRIAKMKPVHPTNMQRLKCTICGHMATYDIGMVSFDPERWEQSNKIDEVYPGPDESIEESVSSLLANLQFSAYIRCVNCNGAGAWEFASPKLVSWVMANFATLTNDENKGFVLGRMQAEDGTSTQWKSGLEEVALERLAHDPANGHLWNKLGNIYKKGGRPDLAAVAFERSLAMDPMHIESNYTLATMLLEIEEFELAASHYRQVLVCARFYKELDAVMMRDMVAASVHDLLIIHHETKGAVPSFPTDEELAAVRHLDEENFQEAEKHSNDIELQLDDWDSLQAVAEMYMGKLLKEIPEQERLLHKYAAKQALSESEPEEQRNNYPATGWGSLPQPIVVRVQTPERALQVERVCDHFNWYFIMGIEFMEDLTDLKKAIMERFAPANVYDPCPCGSGEKFKFCCGKKMKNFDLDTYLRTFESEEIHA